MQFDRIVSIECLEHSRNYAKIFKRLSQCLVTEGKMFVQILGHREYTYFMGESWMVGDAHYSLIMKHESY